MQNSGKRSATDLNLATVLINLNYNYCYIGVLFYMYAFFMCCKCCFRWFRCSLKSTRKKRFVKKGNGSHRTVTLRKQLRVLGKSQLKFPLDPFLRGEYFNLKKKYRKEAKLAKKRYEENIMNHPENVRSSNPKEYWNLIKMINNNAESNKTWEIDSTSWFNYFKKLSNKTSLNLDEQDINNLINSFGDIENNTLDNTISVHDMEKAVKFLKNKKARGLDSITNEMIKFSAHLLLNCST